MTSMTTEKEDIIGWEWQAELNEQEAENEKKVKALEEKCSAERYDAEKANKRRDEMAAEVYRARIENRDVLAKLEKSKHRVLCLEGWCKQLEHENKSLEDDVGAHSRARSALEDRLSKIQRENDAMMDRLTKRKNFGFDQLEQENEALKKQLDDKEESKIEVIYDATDDAIPSSWIENKSPPVAPPKKKRVVRAKKLVTKGVAESKEESKEELLKDAVYMAIAQGVLAAAKEEVAPEPAVETKACGVCDEIGWNTMKNTELIDECTKLGIKGVKKIPKAKIIARLMMHYNGTGDGSGNIVGL